MMSKYAGYASLLASKKMMSNGSGEFRAARLLSVLNHELHNTDRRQQVKILTFQRHRQP